MCDGDDHDFQFWGPDDTNFIPCACGAKAALFDPATGDLTGIADIT